MTMLFPEIVTCALCGTKVQHNQLNSTNEFGWADLDLRPPPDHRHWLDREIQHCAACGYCAPTLSKKPGPNTKRTILSEQYQLSLHDTHLPTAARYFACWALIAHAQGYIARAAWATLKAAWICDDYSHAEMAMQFRAIAAPRFETAIAAQDWPCDGEPLSHAVLVDVLRRSWQLGAAVAKAKSALLVVPATRDNEAAIDILNFQLTLCAREDFDCHDIGEARRASPHFQLYEQRKKEEYENAHAKRLAQEAAQLAERQALMPEKFLAALHDKAQKLFVNSGETPLPEASGSAQSANRDLAERLLSQFPMPYSIKILMLANLDAYGWPAKVCTAALGLATRVHRGGCLE